MMNEMMSENISINCKYFCDSSGNCKNKQIPRFFWIFRQPCSLICDSDEFCQLRELRERFKKFN